MHKSIKKHAKKYFLTILCIVICVTIFANQSILKKPIISFANTFSKYLIYFVLPKRATNKNAKKPTTTITTTTAQSTSKHNKTILTDASEKGGKVISQTIDKSGATSSFGDVFIKNKTEKQVDIKKAIANKPTFNIKLNPLHFYLQ